ncbi:C2H2-type zinc finger transcription factor [Phycomyces blakesleeanus]|uniref:C2H2-type zinc finger transcription factor n=1 Tax=Phycomyces blakesleeanus TaxID=4837 RepID=A0ABR3AHQ4_PHYBL
MLIAGAWYPFFFLFFFSVRPFSATMSATLTQHFDGYIDSDFFRCPLCPPTEHTLFFSARAFSLHGSHKHKRKFVNDWKCYECAHSFATRDDFIHHDCVTSYVEPHLVRVPPILGKAPDFRPIDDFSVISTAKAFICPCCPRQYTEAYSLQRHHLLKHKRYLRIVWTCPCRCGFATVEKLDVTNHVKYDCSVGTDVDDVDLDNSICYGCDQYFPSCDIVAHRQTHPGFVDALAGTWRLPFAGTDLSSLHEIIGLVGWDSATVTQHLRQKRIWKHPNIISSFLHTSSNSPQQSGILSLVGNYPFSALSANVDVGVDYENDLDDTPIEAFDTPLGALDNTTSSQQTGHRYTRPPAKTLASVAHDPQIASAAPIIVSASEQASNFLRGLDLKLPSLPFSSPSPSPSPQISPLLLASSAPVGDVLADILGDDATDASDTADNATAPVVDNSIIGDTAELALCNDGAPATVLSTLSASPPSSHLSSSSHDVSSSAVNWNDCWNMDPAHRARLFADQDRRNSAVAAHPVTPPLALPATLTPVSSLRPPPARRFAAIHPQRLALMESSAASSSPIVTFPLIGDSMHPSRTALLNLVNADAPILTPIDNLSSSLDVDVNVVPRRRSRRNKSAAVRPGQACVPAVRPMTVSMIEAALDSSNDDDENNDDNDNADVEAMEIYVEKVETKKTRRGRGKKSDRAKGKATIPEPPMLTHTPVSPASLVTDTCTPPIGPALDTLPGLSPLSPARWIHKWIVRVSKRDFSLELLSLLKSVPNSGAVST